MDVHIGKSHTDNFEGDICDFKQTKLSDIKEHMEKKHGHGKYLQI